MTSELDRAFAELAQKVRNFTVSVRDGSRGAGSGVLWSGDGAIVTNAHVVRGERPAIEFADGRRAVARTVRRDPSRDLALLQLDARDVDGATPATVRDSASLRAGELVVAVGHPHGLAGALTAGIVQRSGRRFIVSDVHLAPGNSGGPLGDAAGRVVGINSMIAGGQAISIPSDAVSAFLGASGAARPRLGVGITPVALAVDGVRRRALMVTEIAPGGVAERSGLLPGDVLLRVGATSVEDAAGLQAALARATRLSLVRGGRVLDLALDWNGSARAA